ncbi:hypothetical protein A2333_01390 [Candidatus Wolfebacteria bacterium RIFOXYB2_FULL_49_7]|uniref:DUF2975 domain-containing protein n=1 Tax=Candidatus Wolfebacteria bacterium RIFOXYB1_FULL_54_12 TaxID=1802559 RepID=A0A1F8DXH5_9BACT|nr:MAG: hypothetical protein A2372_02435 [Candidatus Wolfebacteria bacterium RIFOXYB1_FULL_54_12]OGM95865.1 MAG: hypothetical protein A2333_01390 [Candidatus Wolfebacteria bacterium RIFOXYB2_FULL_49_7]
MKKSSILFLRAVTVLIGIGVLAFLLWEPWVEGVNAHAVAFSEVYFDDPFLAYMYLGSIPFFVGLYQTFKVLGYAGQNKIFSQAAVNALRIIKYCAFITAGAIVAAGAYLMIAARSSNDDAAGAVMLGMIATLISLVTGTVAARFERTLRNRVRS